MNKLKTLLQIFWSFFKIGAFTFGGGYAMIPIIQKETVENHGWISDDDILEIVTIAESTPGPIAINSATFVGYRTCGFWGSVCATFGVVLPSFVIISLISTLISEFHSIKWVQYAFFGIRAGVLALVLKALWGMFKKCKKNAFAYCVMAFAFVATAVLDASVLLIIVCCAVFGLVYSLLTERRNKA